MIRNSQSWHLGEPNLDNRRRPVVQNIAQLLGCIRPYRDIDLPVHSVFPEDEAGMSELARQLGEQSHKHDEAKDTRDIKSATHVRTNRASSSELDHSDLGQGYQKMALSNHNALSLLHPSFASSRDIRFSTTPFDADPNAIFAFQSSPVPNFATTNWSMRNKTQANPMGMQFEQQTSSRQNLAMLNKDMLGNDFGATQTDYVSCLNPAAMAGMKDL